MRVRLEAYIGTRRRYRALFERSSVVRGGTDQPLLLRNLQDVETNEMIADHLWLKAGEWSKPLMADDEFEFNATVMPYVKGYLGTREDVIASNRAWDFTLARPARIVIVRPSWRRIPS